MTRDDLPAVDALTYRAFAGLVESLTGHAPAHRVFPESMFALRLASDPEGCFVAEIDGVPVGALFSVARGTLGWFGPVATAPEVQREGAGRALVAACLDSWKWRGVRLGGLETLGSSSHHVRLYSSFGFRPAWNGVVLVGDLPERPEMPAGVRSGGDLPPLDFVYPGMDVSREVGALEKTGAGFWLSTGDGLAIALPESQFGGPDGGFLPFLAAPTRQSFDLLLRAAEHEFRRRGKRRLVVRAPASSWRTLDALTGRGYRLGESMVRMKLGDRLDYDRAPIYYCDNWL